MPEDTLKDKLWKAIDYNITSSGRKEAVNKCEKIMLQEKIDLLNKYIPIIAKAEIIVDGFICSHTMGAQVMDLTAKLNSLK